MMKPIRTSRNWAAIYFAGDEITSLEAFRRAIRLSGRGYLNFTTWKYRETQG